jgi:hypothetical protein
MRNGLIAAVVLAVAVPVRAADIDKYLPDDAGLVVHINVKQLLESDVVKKYGLEKAREHLKSNEEANKILEELGFDPFKDLTSVTLTIPSIEMEPKTYIIAHGQFDVAKIEAKAEEVAKNMGDVLKIEKEGNHKIYEVNPPGNPKPGFVALPDKNTIVISTEKEFVVASFARASGQKKVELKKDVQDILEKVDGKQSLWMAVPGSVLAKGIAQFPVPDDAKAKVEKVNSVSAGVTVATDIKLGFTLQAKSADNAKELAEDSKKGLDELKGQAGTITALQPKLAFLADLVGSLKVDTEGTAVTIKGEVSQELIAKSLKD